ncbi:MAG: sensor histidine kinase [Phycisphaerales bacterium JB040]
MTPSHWIAVVVGALVGSVATALIARVVVTRSVRRQHLAQRRAQAAERLAEVGAMTGGLAHEIKNPLSTIGMNAQLLSEGLDDLPRDRAPDEQDRQRLIRRVDALRRETDRLRGILEDFLEYAGELHLDRAGADLNTAVEELADFFQPQATSAGVRLRTELAPGPLTASLDVPHLKQAALNLMLNAVQAMDTRDNARARELILRTSRATDPDAQPVVRLHVIDTGPGIPENARATIFQPYFTTKSGGTGLGLPTSKRIAEAHHGRLEFHTDPAHGTEFTITIPATQSSD